MNNFIGCFESAGFNHCNPKVNSIFLSGNPMIVKFMRESDNQYDNNAIRIDCRGQKIGYVPRGQIQISGSDRYCSGNYNQFFAQCLDAGVQFNGIAYRQLQSKDGNFRFDAGKVINGTPIVCVFSDKYDVSKYEKFSLDLSEDGINELCIQTDLKFICNCTYFDEYAKFTSFGGCIWYNEFNDSFIVWCGKNIEPDNVAVHIKGVQQLPNIGMAAIGECSIDKELLIKQNPVISNRKELFEKLLRRFS